MATDCTVRRMSEQNRGIRSLDGDCLRVIYTFLDGLSLVRCELTSRELRTASTPVVWERLHREAYGRVHLPWTDSGPRPSVLAVDQQREILVREKTRDNVNCDACGATCGAACATCRSEKAEPAHEINIVVRLNSKPWASVKISCGFRLRTCIT